MDREHAGLDTNTLDPALSHHLPDVDVLGGANFYATGMAHSVVYSLGIGGDAVTRGERARRREPYGYSIT